MPLSDTKIRALKPREKKYLEVDEKGLAIEVTPSGAKRWVFIRWLFHLDSAGRRHQCGR